MADHQPLRAIGQKHGVELLVARQGRRRRIDCSARRLRFRIGGNEAAIPKRSQRIAEHGSGAFIGRGHRCGHALVDRVERLFCIFSADPAVHEERASNFYDRRIAGRPFAKVPDGLQASLCSTQPSG